MKYPQVTIIIPYNVDRGWLHEAIASVKNQTYKGEIQLLLEHSDNTVGYNINRGLEKATGKYVKYMAEDDFLTPDCVEKCVYFLERTKNRWMHANSNIIWMQRKPTDHNYITVQVPPFKTITREMILQQCMIHGGTVMYETSLFREIGLFDETLRTAEEYEFYLRLYKANIKPGYLNEIVFNYRRHELQKSLGNKDAEYQAWRKSVVKEIQTKHK